MEGRRRGRPKRLERDPAYALLRELKATRVTREHKARVGAHAVGIGRKEVNGRRTGTLALRYYVSTKQALGRLSAAPIPREVTFVSRKDQREHRLPTDVIQAPQDVFEQDPQTRLRPAPGGCSYGIPGSTGTLGGWVWDLTDDTIVALTNNHVLEDTVGADIIQPGSADGGSLPDDKIGDVKRTIPRSTTTTNLVDCAIGDVDDSDDVDASVIDIGDAVYAATTAELDMLVEKSGRTLGHTFGEVIDVDYAPTVTGGFEFDDCVRIDRVAPTDDWSTGGDSGSLVFRQEDLDGFPPVIGLHMSGSGTAGTANKIQNVFDALDLTTICAGFFQAFIEALFESEEEAEISPATRVRLRELGAAAPRARRGLPPPITPRLRRHARNRRFHAGISRDLQARLRDTKRGQAITDFVDVNRARLTELLMKDGDLRRATIATLRPLVAGATTTTDVLGRAFTAEDIAGLQRLADEVERKGGGDLSRSLKSVRALAHRAEGKTAAQILNIKL